MSNRAATGEYVPRLNWLGDLLSACNVPVDLTLEPQPDRAQVTAFDYGPALPPPLPLLLQTDPDRSDAWREQLANVLRGRVWTTCLANLLAIPPRTLREDVPFQVENPNILEDRKGGAPSGAPEEDISTQRLHDAPAFLARLIHCAEDGNTVAALAPAAIFTNRSAASLRGWLAVNHKVEWIVWFGASASTLIGAHSMFQLALLVIRVGKVSDGVTSLTRLVDLADHEQSEWLTVIDATARREGGEVGSSIVLRNHRFDSNSWTYARFSKSFSARRADAQQLGTLQPLSKVAQLTVGLQRNLIANHLIDLEESETQLPAGIIAYYGGRSVNADGTLGLALKGIESNAVPVELQLQPGDVLIRSIAGLNTTGSRLMVAQVRDTQLPATFDRSCIRVRWQAGVSPDGADLLTGYLTSAHARDWLVAHGAGTVLDIATLRTLEVPAPSSEVLEALRALTQAEQQYQEWAQQAQWTRRSLFATTSFASQIPALIAAQRTETERLRAARDAEGIDYQIRNYYPHPIALRREFIRQMEPGESQLRAVLDCAEHLVTLLALMAMLQDWSEAAPTANVTSKPTGRAPSDAFHLDWGKCIRMLQEGVRSSARTVNPLLLHFPGLTELAAPMQEHSSRWNLAERQLRGWRNNQAHLQRLPEAELDKMSAEFVGLLDDMLQTAAFLGTIPLVRVADYERSLTGERRAAFHLLQGSSVAFQRVVEPVTSELSRGAVGFRTQQGRFIPAFPWLLMDPCPLCKRLEIFVFNRYEKGLPTYVAMETGHPRQSPELSVAIANILQTDRSARSLLG